MDSQNNPDKILELVFCHSKQGKFTEQWQCVSLQISRTKICKCKVKYYNEVPESFFTLDEELV